MQWNWLLNCYKKYVLWGHNIEEDLKRFYSTLNIIYDYSWLTANATIEKSETIY